MSLSGITADDNVLKIYDKMKLTSNVKNEEKRRCLFMKIINDQIKEDDKIKEEPGPRFSDFKTVLEKNYKKQPVYVLLDFDVLSEEGESKEKKLVLIHWSPDESEVKQRMLYASSKDALKRMFNGVSIHVQANDPSELEYDVIHKKAKKNV